jgi:hypothetical protein
MTARIWALRDFTVRGVSQPANADALAVPVLSTAEIVDACWAGVHQRMVVIAQKNPIRSDSCASRQIIDMGMPLDGIESQPRPSRLVSVAITIAMVFALLLIVLVLIAFFASAIATADHPLSGTSVLLHSWNWGVIGAEKI